MRRRHQRGHVDRGLFEFAVDVQVAKSSVRTESGVVDQDVQRVGTDDIHQCLDARLRPEVCGDNLGRTVSDGLRQLSQLLGAPTRDDHLVTAPVQFGGEGAANSSGGTGDQSSFSHAPMLRSRIFFRALMAASRAWRTPV